MQRTGLLATIARLAGFYAIAVLLVVGAVLAGTAGHANADQAPAAVCTTDADCAAWDAAHGITSDGGPTTTAPTSDEVDFTDCATTGNFQCGIGDDSVGPVMVDSADGGFAWSCPTGSTVRQNDAGAIVCDYSRAI